MLSLHPFKIYLIFLEVSEATLTSFIGHLAFIFPAFTISTFSCSRNCSSNTLVMQFSQVCYLILEASRNKNCQGEMDSVLNICRSN